LTTEPDRFTAPLAALAVLALSAMLVSDQRYLRGEVGAFEMVNESPRWIGAPLELVMPIGTLGAGLVLIAAVAVTHLPKRPRPVVAVAVATLVAWRLDDLVKAIIERPRPEGLPFGPIVRDHATGYGFPSGHTTLAFAFATVLHPLLPARVRWIPWAIATAVGLARMYVGVHWPMDVVGGAALGIAVGAAANALTGSHYRRRPA
jgi:membrane-associated phospholipid phosphatase